MKFLIFNQCLNAHIFPVTEVNYKWFIIVLILNSVQIEDWEKEESEVYRKNIEMSGKLMLCQYLFS